MVKTVKLGKTTENKCSKEIILFLDSLCQKKFYGEITFYFQSGNIEFCRKTERLSKTDIVKKIQSVYGGG
ncbi:hypothetical protein [Treponema pedis]|uniref:hypothetical protein n=1 Tax=Treponema pedis TaxID=409322 RepID=UPI00041AD045|nr:hypothetical protein [Treponema pedis]